MAEHCALLRIPLRMSLYSTERRDCDNSVRSRFSTALFRTSSRCRGPIPPGITARQRHDEGEITCTAMEVPPPWPVGRSSNGTEPKLQQEGTAKSARASAETFRCCRKARCMGLPRGQRGSSCPVMHRRKPGVRPHTGSRWAVGDTNAIFGSR